MYHIIKIKPQELRVDVVKREDGAREYETYHNFSLGPPPLYKLYVSYASYYTRSGNAGLYVF